MSDIKNVLSLLCHHLKLSIDVSMKPEYFRSAKFNDAAENVVETFWKALNTLSYHVVRETQMEVDFRRYDTVWATKLYFAYLQYPSIEFYASSEHDKNSRQLLLALAWLLGTRQALDAAIRANLSNCVLGRECSTSNDSELEREAEHEAPETIVAWTNGIVRLHGKTNYNIREIYNLVSERASLISKVHAATTNVHGLPHLTVSELALTKRIATTDKNELSQSDKRYMQELLTAGNLLSVHAEWQRKERIFFEWMVTVVREHKMRADSSLRDTNRKEIFKFISVLRRIMEERIEVSSREENGGRKNETFESVSRSTRIEMGRDAMENRLREMSAELERETKSLSESKIKLSEELKKLLRLIPSCIQL